MSSKVPGTSRRNGKYLYRYACMAVLVAVSAFVFFKNWYEFVEGHNVTGKLLGYGNLGMSTGLFMALYFIVGRWLHAFKIGVERMTNIVLGQILTVLTVAIIEVPLSCAVSGQFRFFFLFIKHYIKVIGMLVPQVCVLTIIMVVLYRHLFPPLKVVEIYGDNENDLYHKINALKYKYDVELRVPLADGEDVIREKIAPYDAVLINDIAAHERNMLLKMCFDMNKRVYYVPKLSDVLVKNSDELNLIDAPLFLNRNNGINPWQRFWKRFFDIVISLIVLIISSPIMLITAVAIYIEDKGPIFFRQERVTIRGKRFDILKFRSMIPDAEKDGRPHPAGEKDDRITKVGRVIRAIRFDELPQLFNILKGDMSVVGPRPERWEHVEEYTKEIPEFAFRNKMKGGLTGYAQVYGKYNTTALDKLKLDLLYITNYSLILDMQIILETIKILFIRESTEGFSEEERKKMQETTFSGGMEI